jgi:phage head maturation protease
LRTINSISSLVDVSPVYRAAYEATSVNARGLEAAKIKAKDLEDYFTNLRGELYEQC